MPTPTSRHMNFGTVTFTPAGGSATPITGIKSASFDEGVSVKKESADGDLFPTVSVNDYNEPTVTISTLNAFALSAQLAGQKGTLVVTILDAYNKATVGGGGMVYTLSNCQIESRGADHKHREFSTSQLKFGAVSADGATHPMSISAL